VGIRVDWKGAAFHHDYDRLAARIAGCQAIAVAIPLALFHAVTALSAPRRRVVLLALALALATSRQLVQSSLRAVVSDTIEVIRGTLLKTEEDA